MAKTSHRLTVYPHSWLSRFIDNPAREDVQQVKQQIVANLRERERENAVYRKKHRIKVMGAQKLRAQPLLKPHKPKKTGRKVFVQTVFKQLRLALLEERRALDRLCREIYQYWCRGDFSVAWPPGTFTPPLPPRASALA